MINQCPLKTVYTEYLAIFLTYNYQRKNDCLNHRIEINIVFNIWVEYLFRRKLLIVLRHVENFTTQEKYILFLKVTETERNALSIFIGNGIGNPCSNPGRGRLHFASCWYPWERYESIGSLPLLIIGKY